MKLVQNPVNVLPSISTPTVVDCDKYYGGTEGDDKYERGFITQTGWREGNYVLRTIQGITHGNGWQLEEKSSDLAKTIRYFISMNWKFYEFDTAEELFRWVLRLDK